MRIRPVIIKAIGEFFGIIACAIGGVFFFGWLFCSPPADPLVHVLAALLAVLFAIGYVAKEAFGLRGGVVVGLVFFAAAGGSLAWAAWPAL